MSDGQRNTSRRLIDYDCRAQILKARARFWSTAFRDDFLVVVSTLTSCSARVDGNGQTPHRWRHESAGQRASWPHSKRARACFQFIRRLYARRRSRACLSRCIPTRTRTADANEMRACSRERGVRANSLGSASRRRRARAKAATGKIEARRSVGGRCGAEHDDSSRLAFATTITACANVAKIRHGKRVSKRTSASASSRAWEPPSSREWPRALKLQKRDDDSQANSALFTAAFHRLHGANCGAYRRKQAAITSRKLWRSIFKPKNGQNSAKQSPQTCELENHYAGSICIEYFR